MSRGTTTATVGIVVAVVGIVVGAFVAIAIDQCWLGLGSCPPEPPDIRIDAASSVFNAPGYDDPSDEYVCLVNADDKPVDMAGWELREGKGDVVNTLPSFTLAPGAGVRVHPGEGRSTKHDLFGESGSPVWTNGGDSVLLVNAAGEEVSSVAFGSQDEHLPASRCA